MTDAEISRRLALAIGWPHVQTSATGLRALVSETDHEWYGFDYRDPAVIWPIAEHFNAFPLYIKESKDWTALVEFNFRTEASSDTAAKAVAIAVIKAHEVKK